MSEGSEVYSLSYMVTNFTQRVSANNNNTLLNNSNNSTVLMKKSYIPLINPSNYRPSTSQSQQSQSRSNTSQYMHSNNNLNSNNNLDSKNSINNNKNNNKNVNNSNQPSIQSSMLRPMFEHVFVKTDYYEFIDQEYRLSEL